MKEFWKGYRAMKRLAYDYCNADRAFAEIYNSNVSDKFVAGARYALKYIKRVGVANITA
jgi:hypothetical protein